MADEKNAGEAQQPPKKKLDDNDGPGNILAGVQKDDADGEGGDRERRDS